MSYKDDLVMKIATSNNCELIGLQYEAIIENIQELKIAIEENQKEVAERKSDKIREIIANLISSLGEEQSEFRDKSVNMYFYINGVITDVSIKKNIGALENIIQICNEQREAWYDAGKKMRADGNQTASAYTYGKTDVNINASIKDFGSV